VLVCSTEYQNWRHGHCYSQLVDCGIVNLDRVSIWVLFDFFS
jgi:hypothetical protein